MGPGRPTPMRSVSPFQGGHRAALFAGSAPLRRRLGAEQTRLGHLLRCREDRSPTPSSPFRETFASSIGKGSAVTLPGSRPRSRTVERSSRGGARSCTSPSVRSPASRRRSSGGWTGTGPFASSCFSRPSWSGRLSCSASEAESAVGRTRPPCSTGAETSPRRPTIASTTSSARRISTPVSTCTCRADLRTERARLGKTAPTRGARSHPRVHGIPRRLPATLAQPLPTRVRRPRRDGSPSLTAVSTTTWLPSG